LCIELDSYWDKYLLIDEVLNSHCPLRYKIVLIVKLYMEEYHFVNIKICLCRGADKSLARQGRRKARKHVKDARDFNNIETLAVIKFFFPLQGKASKEIHTILTEILACFLPSRAKDLSALL